jgi:hypothetical protein
MEVLWLAAFFVLKRGGLKSQSGQQLSKLRFLMIFFKSSAKY